MVPRLAATRIVQETKSCPGNPQNEGEHAMPFKTSLLFMTAAVLGFATAAQAGPVGSPDIDSNLIQLTFDGPTVTSITPTGVYEVTTGEAYSYPPSITSTGSGDQTVWNITFDADRSNSSPVAYDFIQYSGGFPFPYHQWSPVAAEYPGYPMDLNFFFGVNICTVEAGCFTLYLGQGHTDDPLPTNNWWIGSEYLLTASEEADADVILPNGADFIINPLGQGVYTFLITGGLGAPIPEPASGAILMAGVAAAFVVSRTRRDRGKRARPLTL
jgi:hypothetical protein